MTGYDASDPKQVRARNKQAKQRSERYDSAIRAVMGSTDGRAWIYSILDRCHVTSTPFNDNVNRMAFLVGEQNIGLWLQSEVMRVAPVDFVAMLREGPGGRVLDVEVEDASGNDADTE